jgi:site-specific DNA-methyltransferase (adenine-specific)
MIDFIEGDCQVVLQEFEDIFFDACITDPPYGMGMDEWDHNIPPISIWKEVYRVLKPGAFCLSFCSPQLYHRLACSIEDAGFIIQDQIMWMITTKMPKRNKLKPAHEPIAIGQKPLVGSIKNNMKKWGVGEIDIEGVRVPWEGKPPKGWIKSGGKRRTFGKEGKTTGNQREFGTVDANPKGRYPSNIVGRVLPEHQKYFYHPRVTRKERGKYNDHPTPKPVALMEWLIKIYCPFSGLVLDPFCGSGSTGIAALKQGRRFIGIDIEPHYIEIAERKIKEWTQETIIASPFLGVSLCRDSP